MKPDRTRVGFQFAVLLKKIGKKRRINSGDGVWERIDVRK